ncbi:hypothetical protein BV898_07512 [Hypsibius exemplaris]|uniref:t-SNARE coiled-coil homology domain-containing protein n=1 Tax=Hypsibius exemplaris TaxID=2072580 RepID=A0A1W0WTM6_HYPEX|nr:hypothetical protein BV898_07512 [Hypsibius exemplaris]
MTEEYLTRDNQMRSEALSSRVSLLKSIAIDIETETKDQNDLLDNMEKEISGVRGFVTTGKKRATQILKAGNRDRKTTCYVAIAVALFLFSIYYLISRASFGTPEPRNGNPL